MRFTPYQKNKNFSESHLHSSPLMHSNKTTERSNSKILRNDLTLENSFQEVMSEYLSLIISFFSKMKQTKDYPFKDEGGETSSYLKLFYFAVFPIIKILSIVVLVIVAALLLRLGLQCRKLFQCEEDISKIIKPVYPYAAGQDQSITKDLIKGGVYLKGRQLRFPNSINYPDILNFHKSACEDFIEK